MGVVKARWSPEDTKLLMYVLLFREVHGRPPGFVEMMEAMGYASSSTLKVHLDRLIRDGLLEREAETHGTLRPLVEIVALTP